MRRVPWTRQPPYPVGIDWSNPLTLGLCLAFDGATKRDVLSSKFGTPTGTKIRVGSAGVGTGFNTDGVTTTDKVLTGVAGPGGSQRTLFALFNPKSLGGGSLGRLFCASNLADELYLYSASNAAVGYFRHTSGQRSLQFGLSSNVVFGKTMSLSISYDGSSLSNMPIGYVNGALATSSSGDAPISGGVLNPDNICIGNRPTDNARVFDGTIFLALRWNRILSPDEHMSLANNPWQIFEPYTVFDNIPFPIVSGPTSYTLIASGGSYTATGSTAILNRNRKLTANGASYTVTGGTAALLRSKRLTLQGGSYNLTGASATLLRSKRITAQGGSYTLLGSSASIFKSRVLLASGGSYVLNGQQITITYTPTAGAYTLTALGGSYTITGSSAVLKRNRSLTAQGGSYALSGASSIIYRSRNLIAQGGSYTTTGSVATLHHNKLLIASGGVYSVAGSQASLLRSKLLTAQGGSYTVTGQQANLSRNRILQALGGAYLISGGSVVIQRSGMVWPSPDQVLLGVQYGPTGADYVGTMDVFGIKYDIVTGNLIKPISDKVVMTL